MDRSLFFTVTELKKLRAKALTMMHEPASWGTEKDSQLQHLVLLLEETMMSLGRKNGKEPKAASVKAVQPPAPEIQNAKSAAAVITTRDHILPEHLPRFTKSIEPLATERCPYCQGELNFIRNDAREKLEFVKGRFIVNQYIYPQYSCHRCHRLIGGKASIRPAAGVQDESEQDVALSPSSVK